MHDAVRVNWICSGELQHSTRLVARRISFGSAALAAWTGSQHTLPKAIILKSL